MNSKKRTGMTMKPTITYRWLDESQLGLLAEIDRTEEISTAYFQEGSKLVRRDVDWHASPWEVEGHGQHSIYHMMSFCRDHLQRGGVMLGALVDGKLVGAGLLQPKIRPSVVQLAFLHVSNPFRRMGVASQILKELLTEAHRSRAEEMYVSATPTETAVGFYLHHGFRPADNPIPELLALEPEDIHMVLELYQED